MRMCLYLYGYYTHMGDFVAYMCVSYNLDGRTSTHRHMHYIYYTSIAKNKYERRIMFFCYFVYQPYFIFVLGLSHDDHNKSKYTFPTVAHVSTQTSYNFSVFFLFFLLHGKVLEFKLNITNERRRRIKFSLFRLLLLLFLRFHNIK